MSLNACTPSPLCHFLSLVLGNPYFGDVIFEWSLSILCDQDTTLKLLLKVFNENLPLKLERSFFVITAKMVLR